MILFQKIFNAGMNYRQPNDRNEPKIIHGRTPQQLPPKAIGSVSINIISAMTGPNGGLTTVNKKRRHLSISDPDVRFADDDTSSGLCLFHHVIVD